MILKWRILSATNDLDRVSAVALPKLPISTSNTDLKVACPGLGKIPFPLFVFFKAALNISVTNYNAFLICEQVWLWHSTMAVFRSCIGCLSKLLGCSTGPLALLSASGMKRPSKDREPAVLQCTSKLCSSPGRLSLWLGWITMERYTEPCAKGDK